MQLPAFFAQSISEQETAQTSLAQSPRWIASRAGEADIFLGTVTVIASAPTGKPNPYLGRIRSGSPRGTNSKLGQVVIVESAPIDANPY
jgi:hypothetical protein